MGELLFADEIHTVEQAKINAARTTQKAGNERRGAETALQNFSASLSNARAFDAAGAQIADISGNIARLNDAATRGSVQGRIAAAEALGAAAAQAGAAGVGGGSVEMYNQTVRLSQAMREQEADDALGAQNYAAGQQKGNTLKAAVAGMDSNIYRANLDYTQYLDHKKPGFLERTIGLAATAAATVFAGPQAGAAVMGVFEARQAGRNGDMSGVNKALMGSVQNGLGAARSYHVTHGDVAVRQPSSPSNISTAVSSSSDGIAHGWGQFSKPGWFNTKSSFDQIIIK